MLRHYLYSFCYWVGYIYIPYSGKFSRGTIFTEGQSSKILRSNFHGWLFQNCFAHNTWLTLTACAHRLKTDSYTTFFRTNFLAQKRIVAANPFSAVCFPIWNPEKTSHSGLFFVDQNSWSLASLPRFWFYGRWHCCRQRATWIRKLGNITRHLKIA